LKPIFPRLERTRERPGRVATSDAHQRATVNSTNTNPPTDDPLAGHPLPSAALAHGENKSLRHRAMLTLGALGVVFGDIGTSPIYALRQTVEATGGNFPGSMAIMGTL